MSEHEKSIIKSAVKNALCFGASTLSNAKSEIADYGYTWTIEHERFLNDIAIDEIISYLGR